MLAYRNPEEAYGFVVRIQDPDIQRQAMDAVIRNWATRDPAGAAAWAEKLQDEAQQQTAYANIALQWSRRDKEQAVDWIRSLPDTPAKYGAAIAYAAANVTFPDRKSLEEWRRAMSAKDLTRSAAVDWIQKADLPENVRGELMRLFR
jgi:TPR repeat protein